MIRKGLLLLILLLPIFTLTAQTKTESHFWIGHLKVTKTDSLKLVMLVEYKNDTVQFVELDSPDQYSYEIRADKYLIEGDSLFFEINSLKASYAAHKEGDDYRGVFTQGGKSFPLFLKKESIFQRFPPRPQTPKKPYPYLEEEVEIADYDGNLTIKGTLTMPEKGAIKGLVITVTGSGWQDRDQNIFGHKTFLVIADYLTKNGYAVYRYDDPPFYLFNKMTTHDLERNVQEVVNHFNSDDRFSNIPIGILGHSEGGTIACMAAQYNEDKGIDFILSLAGASQPFSEVLIYQTLLISKEMGYSEERLALIEKISRKTYKAIDKASSPKEAQEAFAKVAQKEAAKLSEADQEAIGLTPMDIFNKTRAITPWFYALLKIDITDHLKEISCPVFAINGELDTQVYYKENLAIIEENLPENSLHYIKSYPHLNHLFQHATTGSVQEYKEIEETISTEVLEDILKWLDSIN